MPPGVAEGRGGPYSPKMRASYDAVPGSRLHHRGFGRKPSSTSRCLGLLRLQSPHHRDQPRLWTHLAAGDARRGLGSRHLPGHILSTEPAHGATIPTNSARWSAMPSG